MKTTAAYYLLLIYFTAMCKPVIPLVNDFLAHTFWKTEHVITVHHENGKNHLHYELKKASDQDSKDGNSTSPKSSESVSVHILQQNNFDSYYSIVFEQKHLSGFYNLRSTFLELNTPPPKA